MVKKIFESSKSSVTNNRLFIGTPEFGDTNILIALAAQGSTTSEHYVYFDKSTAVSFINELKRQIAKLDNKAPF